MRAVWFILLMFVASVAYHVSWTVVLSLIQPKAPIPHLLHYALLFVFPATLIVAVGYAMGVLRGVNPVIRLVALSVVGLLLPWLALYPTVTGFCLLSKACF